MMINALHLIWIILSASFGLFGAAIFAVGKRSENNDKGVKG